MAQIFLSYSRVDSKFVETFIQRLQRAFPDHKIWYDQAPHELIGGGNWWNDILAAIAASDVFIYILSNESVNSLYCQAEFTEARRLQKRIITIQARDRTDLTDDLDDIQFINMKDGVDNTEVFASLVAAVNLRVREAQKYRNARPLWKPATPKPNKEILPLRSADSPDIPTSPLEKPSAEVEALRFAKESEQRQIRITLLGIGVTIVVTLFAAMIGLIPWLTERAENAAATQSALALLTPATQAALQPTNSPTDAPTPTLTPTPTESPTPDVEEAARQLLAQQTAQAIIDQATATAARATQDYALNQTQIANLTATATLWTATPTPNMTASVEAVLTRWSQATQTQASMDATATATLWTPTPTPTHTFTPSPTLAPVTRNADWTPQSTTIGTINMVQVPPGCFMMGSTQTQVDEQVAAGIDQSWVEGQLPQHEQCFDASFWIGQTEVTNAQYAEFVRAGGYNEQRYWTDAGWAWKGSREAPENSDGFTDGNQPRVGVSWYEAVAYTRWLTEQLRASGAIGQKEEIRLPTESEWEYAARGPDGLTYPWGNTFDGTRLNFCDTNCGYEWRDATVDDGYGDVTAPVGSYPLGASWVGALDMSGNVWEWSLSGYAEYPYVGTDGRNDISGDITGRVLRGGSWDNLHSLARAAYRLNNSPYSRYNHNGFRLLRAGG